MLKAQACVCVCFAAFRKVMAVPPFAYTVSLKEPNREKQFKLKHLLVFLKHFKATFYFKITYVT